MTSAESKAVLYGLAGSPHRLTAQDFGCVYTFYQHNVPNETGDVQVAIISSTHRVFLAGNSKLFSK